MKFYQRSSLVAKGPSGGGTTSMRFCSFYEHWHAVISPVLPQSPSPTSYRPVQAQLVHSLSKIRSLLGTRGNTEHFQNPGSDPLCFYKNHTSVCAVKGCGNCAGRQWGPLLSIRPRWPAEMGNSLCLLHDECTNPFCSYLNCRVGKCMVIDQESINLVICNRSSGDFITF